MDKAIRAANWEEVFKCVQVSTIDDSLSKKILHLDVDRIVLNSRKGYTETKVNFASKYVCDEIMQMWLINDHLKVERFL